MLTLKRGYTLIEVLLAIAVFTLAILSTLAVFNLSLKVTQSAREDTIATNLAEKQIEHYRSMSFSQISNGLALTQSISELPDGFMKTTTSAYQGSNKITQITIEIYWRNRPSTRPISLTTLVTLGGIDDAGTASPGV